MKCLTPGCGHAERLHDGACRVTGCGCDGFMEEPKPTDKSRQVCIDVPNGYSLTVTLTPMEDSLAESHQA